MITKDQATSAHYRQEFHHGTVRNADGTPARCRVNGQCQTWKTRPDEFKLPVKRGLKETFYITHENAFQWFLTAEDALKYQHPSQYLAICLWGRDLGSSLDYVRREQLDAAVAGAPIDALYEQSGPGGTRTGKWVCVSDLAEGHPFRAKYAAALASK